MPRKNKDKYPDYDQTKQFFNHQMMTSAFAELGPYLSDDWEEWQDEAPDMDDVVVKEGDILGITCTGKMYNTDQSRLVERGKKLIAGMEGRVREFNGPFKDILASMYYTALWF